MIGKSWSVIQHNIQIEFAIMSLILNSTLIFLILRHSPKSLGAYKYLMIYISAFELFYSLMDIIVKPIFHSYGSTFLVMVSTKETGLSLKIALLLGAVYCGCFGASMAIFGIHFVYRYLVAAGSKLLEKISFWKIAFFLLIPVVYGAIWGWVAYDPVGQQPATGEHIKQENNILETFDLELEDMVYIGPYFYQKLPNGTYEVDIMSITGMSIVYIIVSSSFFTIFYFGIKCYRIISQLVPSTSSYRSKQLQSHLFWALVTQTMIPVILMHTPVTLVYAFALLDQDIGMLSGFVSMTIAAYPAIDPLPSLLIIPCYRGALKKYLPCCRRPKDTQQETTNPAGPRTASILSVKPT
ncbi:hypothetical protein L3Y34_008503 [Caenorhabditis briggsae]|uniref:Serpentine receptor class r-10 n=1 Tax=Caenorhabditis briggsae TaxID=6238 RepID=A0AAE9A5S2_CAEBR|nr:hypothetical protein L3Y34_008503 [Caenorhabditis briggsae]